MTCVILNRGTWGGGVCNRDKKYCYFYLELNYGLNTGLKQRKYVCDTIKGSISNFRIIFFFSFFLDFPHVSRFNITQVSYVLPQLGHKQQLSFYLVFLFCFSCCRGLIPLLLILTTLLSDHSVLNFNIFF